MCLESVIDCHRQLTEQNDLIILLLAKTQLKSSNAIFTTRQSCSQLIVLLNQEFLGSLRI